eukprot:scaffold1839_cov382-Prasinococcus_capsulatus_cf.AAC.28
MSPPLPGPCNGRLRRPRGQDRRRSCNLRAARGHVIRPSIHPSIHPSVTPIHLSIRQPAPAIRAHGGRSPRRCVSERCVVGIATRDGAPAAVGEAGQWPQAPLETNEPRGYKTVDATQCTV